MPEYAPRRERPFVRPKLAVLLNQPAAMTEKVEARRRKERIITELCIICPPGQEDSKDSADLSVIAYAVAAITGCGALVIARKK